MYDVTSKIFRFTPTIMIMFLCHQDLKYLANMPTGPPSNLLVPISLLFLYTILILTNEF